MCPVGVSRGVYRGGRHPLDPEANTPLNTEADTPWIQRLDPEAGTNPEPEADTPSLVETATEADGTHLTVMHSCLELH